jgi:hypothetical protein
MAAKTLGAKGTNSYKTPRGSNTTVRGDRMSVHQTPRVSRSAARTSRLTGSSYRQGTYSGGVVTGGRLKVKSNQTNKTMKRITVKAYAQKGKTFKAPNRMPSKLNNTAAAAISSRRYKAVGVGIGTLGGWAAPLVVAGGVNVSRKNNNASLRLRAAGYRVGGTGFKGVVKPASPRAQQRAKNALNRKAARQSARGTSKIYIANGGKFANGSRGNVVIKTTTTRAGRKAAAPKNNGGRRNVRVRRDGRGRFNGSY